MKMSKDTLSAGQVISLFEKGHLYQVAFTDDNGSYIIRKTDYCFMLQPQSYGGLNLINIPFDKVQDIVDLHQLEHSEFQSWYYPQHQEKEVLMVHLHDIKTGELEDAIILRNQSAYQAQQNAVILPETRGKYVAGSVWSFDTKWGQYDRII